MTEQSDREPTLWVTDAEIIRRLGAPEKIAYQAIHMLDRNRASGFPQKNKLWGGRRYWPAVKRYFDQTNGMFPQAEHRRAG
jgi:hypothetical protein